MAITLPDGEDNSAAKRILEEDKEKIVLRKNINVIRQILNDDITLNNCEFLNVNRRLKIEETF